eukprot:1157472-Pelagomonas_calceolata.AAC.4
MLMREAAAWSISILQFLVTVHVLQNVSLISWAIPDHAAAQVCCTFNSFISLAQRPCSADRLPHLMGHDCPILHPILSSVHVIIALQDVSLISWAMAVLRVHPSPPFMAQWLQDCP